MEQQKVSNNQQLTNAIEEMVKAIHLSCEKLFREDREHIHLAINDLLEVWLEFTRHVIKNADALAHVQLVYWQDYLLLCKDLNQRLQNNSSALGIDANQQKNAILANFIEKYSFLISQHVQVVFRKVFASDSAADFKNIEFYTQQFARVFQSSTEKYFSISS